MRGRYKVLWGAVTVLQSAIKLQLIYYFLLFVILLACACDAMTSVTAEREGDVKPH